MAARPRRVLIVGTENPYGHRVVSGIHTYCQRHADWDYHLEDKLGAESAPRTRFAIREWKAEGILYQVITVPLDKLIVGSGVPAVSFSGSMASPSPKVIADSEKIGRMVARHFLDNGSRNFGFCAWTGEPMVRLRYKGFSEELARAGFRCDLFTDRYLGLIESDWVSNRRRMEQWLLRLEKPVAIMCIYDARGQEISWMCRRLGLRVPDDVALVAVGNDETLCRMCKPELSSVDTNAEQIGFEAARLLDRLMRGHKRPAKPIFIRPRRLVARASSDIVAVDDPEVATAVRFIRDHAHEPISVKDVVQLIAISRRALELRFDRKLGRSPKAEIVRVRMERAKALLSETDLPVSVVATESGFSSQVKFSAAFRRECSQTPSHFRKASRLGRSIQA